MNASRVSYFNFCIHSEMLYDENTYEALLRFAKEFYGLTGKRIAICVSTPLCPLVAKAMAEKGVRRDIFDSRVLALNEFADIGYHGHFYRRAGNKLTQVSGANYDKDIVVGQIRREMGWFKEIGLSPKIYVAGWWFLTKDIVLELERHGITVDASVRKGKADTFGATYINSDEIPEYGEPFTLPPSRTITEIQSIFGPVMPAILMRYHLSKYLNKKTSGNPFFIFPLHDWDVPKHYRNIVSNVKSIGGSGKDMGWMSIMEMREYLPQHKWVEAVLDKAQALASDLEPWPHYFESKAREFRVVSELLKTDNSASILEIGCGNGFTSALFAVKAGRVTAFDLPHRDPRNHSVGIDAAHKFMKAMNIKNVEVVSGSVERLPFNDESFDVVFSGYMLQYVPDKIKALGEMRRVLKRDGVIITVVPNFITRLYAPIMQYKYVIGKALYRLVNKPKGQPKLTNKGSPVVNDDKKRSKRLLDHLLLRPDGAYKSFMEELINHRPSAWRKLFKRNQLKVVDTFSTEVMPLALFDLLGPSASKFIVKRSFGLNRWLSKIPLVKECGYSLGIVARKI